MTRRAGEVMRYHTWPTITNQTVADHSFHVMRIYDEVMSQYVPWSIDLMRTILWHDMGEEASGDIPYPVKKNNPDLSLIINRIEEEHVRKMVGKLPGISKKEYAAFKIAEYLEMAEYARYEMNLGNRYAEEIWNRINNALCGEQFSEFYREFPDCRSSVAFFLSEREVIDES